MFNPREVNNLAKYLNNCIAQTVLWKKYLKAAQKDDGKHKYFSSLFNLDIGVGEG